jgi:lysozyme
MPESNLVIDLSHHNQNLDFASIRSGGILGIIHKATQGLGYADPTYLPHRASALANGMLWGAYHFGTGSDGVQQAERFLDVVKPGAQTLLVLDFEANGQGPSMTLEEARAFVTHVNDQTGRYPGLYSGHYIKDLLGFNGDEAGLRALWGAV